MIARPVFLLGVALALFLGAAAPADAQRTPSPRSGEERARLEERMRARVAEIMRTRIGIDREDEARLSAIAEEFEGRRRALRAEERETRQQIEAFVRAGRTDDPQAARLLDRALGIRTREADLVREEQARLLQVLSPTQLLQFNELRLELGRRIRALRNDAGSGGRDGRGGGEVRSDGAPGDSTPATERPPARGTPGA